MKTAHIALVDDNPQMLLGLERLLTGRGFNVRSFCSAKEFLAGCETSCPDCAIFDLAMPEIDGLTLQDLLRRRGVSLPIIFLSGEGNIPACARALKAGAVNFLTKPVDATAMLSSLREALAKCAKERACENEVAGLRERFAQLSPRELEVLGHVIAGKLNKQIAGDLGIAEQTVKIHRMRLTEKTGLPSVAELVRASALLGIPAAA